MKSRFLVKGGVPEKNYLQYGREKLLVARVETRVEHAPQGCKASALTTAPILFHSPTN